MNEFELREKALDIAMKYMSGKGRSDFDMGITVRVADRIFDFLNKGADPEPELTDLQLENAHCDERGRSIGGPMTPREVRAFYEKRIASIRGWKGETFYTTPIPCP